MKGLLFDTIAIIPLLASTIWLTILNVGRTSFDWQLYYSANKYGEWDIEVTLLIVSSVCGVILTLRLLRRLICAVFQQIIS